MALDLLRSSLHRAITTTRGDGLLPVRVSKDLLRRVNVTFGRPLGSREELAKRREAKERLAALRASGQKSSIARCNTASVSKLAGRGIVVLPLAVPCARRKARWGRRLIADNNYSSC